MELKGTASSIHGEAGRSMKRDFLWMWGSHLNKLLMLLSGFDANAQRQQSFMNFLMTRDSHRVYSLLFTHRVRKTMSGDWYDQSLYLLNSQDHE